MPYVEVPDWTTFPKLSRDRTFAKAVRRAVELKGTIKELESELRELQGDVLEPSLLAGGVKQNQTIQFEDWNVAVRDVPSGSKIDEQKLIQSGVSKRVIEKCRVEGKRRHYVEVRERKQQEQAGRVETVNE